MRRVPRPAVAPQRQTAQEASPLEVARAESIIFTHTQPYNNFNCEKKMRASDPCAASTKHDGRLLRPRPRRGLWGAVIPMRPWSSFQRVRFVARVDGWAGMWVVRRSRKLDTERRGREEGEATLLRSDRRPRSPRWLRTTRGAACPSARAPSRAAARVHVSVGAFALRGLRCYHAYARAGTSLLVRPAH